MNTNYRASPEDSILAALSLHAFPISLAQLKLSGPSIADIPQRTLQFTMKKLVGAGQVIQSGAGPSVRYQLSKQASPTADAVQLSDVSAEIIDLVSRPQASRSPVGYDYGFLNSYQPNQTWYLTGQERLALSSNGRPAMVGAEAGTYARQILGRLLIDLAWNSSRLEGSTYSLLDTQRLIEFGRFADGHTALEAQMILNHKDAIEFLVKGAAESSFNRTTILNLHALLANNLLADVAAVGRLRTIGVGIGGSVFMPLEIPQQIKAQFDAILSKASAITDPFEQAFFVMVHLPYLQPFDDVNKRVSRLAANIPLVRANLAPLSFTDVPQDLYTRAMLAIYELNRIEPLKELFIWAYQRSAARYVAVQQTIGAPDPFRLTYRNELREVIAMVITGLVRRQDVESAIVEATPATVAAHDRETFTQLVQGELLVINDGNFARYRVRPSQFKAWKDVWDG
jgi:Fic/DOC family